MKYIIFVVSLALLAVSSYADSNVNSVNFSSVKDLKNPLYYYPEFVGKTINTDSKIISLDLPKRAADAAFVPLKINIGHAQKDLFIQKIWVFIDNNPVPLAALFKFGKASAQASLAFNIRINENSFVRAIALTDKNEFYQASNFVKASYGCSLPISTNVNISEGRKHIGKIRLSADKVDSKLDSILAKLKIRHINLTGFQMNQATRIRELPHYVKHIKVSLGDEIVFLAQTGISISENPSFNFYVLNNNDKLKIEVLDTKESTFVNSFAI